MLRVTWEWLGLFEPALDLANTVAVADGDEHDFLAPAGEYVRWAEELEARSPVVDDAQMIVTNRTALLNLRRQVRKALAAAAAGNEPPQQAVTALNRASRLAPTWSELEASGAIRQRSRASASDRLLAEYARSAMRVLAGGSAQLRVCPAPSCGMFFQPTRTDQHWCSKPCGTRARVARHTRLRARGQT